MPNRDLAGYYSAAGIVLNDHWAGVAAWGVLSNRLYDAAASGAFVISDHVDGIEAGRATTGSRPSDRATSCDGWSVTSSATPSSERRWPCGHVEAVVARHTFSHRVNALRDEIEPLARSRRSLHERTS